MRKGLGGPPSDPDFVENLDSPETVDIVNKAYSSRFSEICRKSSKIGQNRPFFTIFLGPKFRLSQGGHCLEQVVKKGPKFRKFRKIRENSGFFRENQLLTPSKNSVFRFFEKTSKKWVVQS